MRKKYVIHRLGINHVSNKNLTSDFAQIEGGL